MSLLITSIMVAIVTIYNWVKCLNVKFDLKKIFFVTILISIITIFLNSFTDNPLTLILTFISFITICYFNITKDLKSAIILVIISEIVVGLAEFSYVMFLSTFFNESLELLMNNMFIYLLLNFYIMIITFLINKVNIPQKAYNLLEQTYNGIKSNEALVYSIIIIVIIIISTMQTYMKLSLSAVLVINLCMASVFIGLVIMSSKIKEKYNKINSKYETSIASLKEYEVMIDKFRVDTHENKNEFLTIRNMLKDQNGKETVIKYIDKLVDNKIKDNDKIMKKTSKIPKGGLRATIYSKLCLMDKLKIKYNLSISRAIQTTDLINLDEDLILKICKILGVFLDNAIDAVKDLKKKEISVEIYTIDDNLCIDITNNFNGKVDLDKMSNMKYTTKGNGHGYGLTLANQLLAENKDKLENEKSINRDNFTQTLKIKHIDIL